MTTPYITYKQLQKAGACKGMLRIFKNTFGTKAAVTNTNTKKYLLNRISPFFEHSFWLSLYLLTPALRTKYINARDKWRVNNKISFEKWQEKCSYKFVTLYKEMKRKR